MDDFMFHLQEARIHLKEIENTEGSYRDENVVELLVFLGHVQEHLNLAWASVSGGKESDAKRIPNWTMDFDLFPPKY